jgi:hypothetical protein
MPAIRQGLSRSRDEEMRALVWVARSGAGNNVFYDTASRQLPTIVSRQLSGASVRIVRVRGPFLHIVFRTG